MTTPMTMHTGTAMIMTECPPLWVLVLAAKSTLRRRPFFDVTLASSKPFCLLPLSIVSTAIFSVDLSICSAEPIILLSECSILSLAMNIWCVRKKRCPCRTYKKTSEYLLKHTLILHASHLTPLYASHIYDITLNLLMYTHLTNRYSVFSKTKFWVIIFCLSSHLVISFIFFDLTISTLGITK